MIMFYDVMPITTIAGERVWKLITRLQMTRQELY